MEKLKANRVIRATALLLTAAAVGSQIRKQLRRLDLRGKRVFISGGSRGLGLVLAREFMRRGCRVAIGARDAAELKRAQDDLQFRFETSVRTVVCDVRRRDQLQRALFDLAAEWGPIDVLVNNAGIIQAGPMEEMTLTDYEEAMDVHYWAPLVAIQTVLPSMRRRRSGAIVNIASIGGKIGVPHLLPYDASKFALVGLSEGLHHELAKDGIHVLTVCPGLMRTGSAGRAYFKGQNRKEYTAFALMASNPITTISAERASREILDALERRDAEVILSWPAKLAARLVPVFPEWAASMLSFVNRFLPEPGGIGHERAEGRDSQTPLAPSVLTRLSDRAAMRNNEVGAPGS